MSAPRIHPTAIIHPGANLPDDVQVGPFAIVDADVTLGAGCTVGPYVNLTGVLVAGMNNHFHAHCVIGGPPQHVAYAGEPTRVEIGDGNTFREYVTVNRGMPASGGVTCIGNGNMFMAASHIGHDCRVGNRCILANGALIGGHAVVGDNAFLSGNICIHQFCRVGRLVMMSGGSASNQDIPPFWVAQGTNACRGVNVIGMKRAGLSDEEITAVRRVYKAINLSGNPIRESLLKVEAKEGHIPVVQEVIQFVRASKRGIVTARGGS